jgi:hypothetical protein
MMIGHLAAFTLLLADERADAILKRFIDANAANAKRAGQYTYLQQVDYFGVNSFGVQRLERSEKREIIFVEGGEYQKLIARDGRPLEPDEQKKEDQRLAQTAADRRKKRGPFEKEVTLSSDAELLTLFDNRLMGEEEIGGRKVWVIDCSPRAAQAKGRHEKEATSFRRKLWIDQTDSVAVRSVETVVGGHVVLMPGATITIDYAKVNDDAWIQRSIVIDGRLRIAKSVQPRARTEYRNSKFQKFDVKSTITGE